MTSSLYRRLPEQRAPDVTFERTKDKRKRKPRRRACAAQSSFPSFPSVRNRFQRPNCQESIMTAIVFGTVLPWLLLFVAAWLGFQLVRQNGRILVRLEAIDKRLAPRRSEKPQEPRGLPAGTVAPDFELPDLAGARHKLSEFRGKDLLLVFSNPKCGFCTKMSADLAALPVEEGAGRPVPVVVTTGELENNRKLVEEHGIRFMILLQKEMEVASKYHAEGTPMGYLVDKSRPIPSDLPTRAEELLNLAERAPVNRNGSDASANGSAKHGEKDYRSLAASRLNRKGLKAGEAAPEFRLPRVDAGELSLAD